MLFVLGSGRSSIRIAVRQGAAAAAAGGDASDLGTSSLRALLLALFPTQSILRLPV